MGVDSTLWEEGGLKDRYFKSVVGVGGSSLCSATYTLWYVQGKPIKVQYFVKSAKPLGDNYCKNKYLFFYIFQMIFMPKRLDRFKRFFHQIT